MEQGKTSTGCAGVDVDKKRLHAAIHGASDAACFDNTAEGIGLLMSWLATRGVHRVGMEATGGYEKALREALQASGVATVLHQPLEIRLFARLKRRHAKNDKDDARLIAAATAQVDAVKAAADPYLGELAERMTAYEQAADLLAQARTYREHAHLADLKASLDKLIRTLAARKKALIADLVGRIRKRSDLAQRFELLLSLPGIGQITAAGLVIRMPELGALKRGQAAALLGVAPFDRDSGQTRGQRFISGGRARPRRLVYMAALAARRLDPALKALAQRMKDAGKKPKVILVAIMRRLIETANLVLKRSTPWIPTTQP